MKIILSRKGFDAAAGGVPSPIFPDGRITSLPIPHAAGISASRCSYDGQPLGQLLRDLTQGRKNEQTLLHLDPDLNEETLPRPKDWKPAFGQVDSAQSHLERHNVGSGDLFLFFGWFRQIILKEGKWQYKSGAPHIHHIFGWLQVDRIVHVSETTDYPSFLSEHPHVAHRSILGKNNTIYIGRDRLALSAQTSALKGAGTFRSYSESLQLTMPGSTKRSIWQLPLWAFPAADKEALSYHENRERWQQLESGSRLASVGRGQEFVLDTACYPESIPWAEELIRQNA